MGASDPLVEDPDLQLAVVGELASAAMISPQIMDVVLLHFAAGVLFRPLLHLTAGGFFLSIFHLANESLPWPRRYGSSLFLTGAALGFTRWLQAMRVRKSGRGRLHESREGRGRRGQHPWPSSKHALLAVFFEHLGTRKTPSCQFKLQSMITGGTSVANIAGREKMAYANGVHILNLCQLL